MRKICEEIVVVAGERLVSGALEDRELLHRSYAEESETQFIEYKYDEYGLYPLTKGPRHFHGVSRYVGAHALSSKIDRILFVDADEVIDSKVVALPSVEVGHLSSYVYVRDEGRRALARQNTILMVEREVLEVEMLLNPYERPGYFWGHLGEKERSILGLKGEPMVHHYNWVRSKPELLQKVANWGHREERDWTRLILEERYDELTPFSYEDVEPVHRVLDTDVEALRALSYYRHVPRVSFSNVRYVTPEDIRKHSIDLLL